jgi:hypothetical protein
MRHLTKRALAKLAGLDIDTCPEAVIARPGQGEGRHDVSSACAWKEGRIVLRTLPLGDDAEIVQTLDCRIEFGLSGIWTVTSQIVEEDDVSHARRASHVITGSAGYGRRSGLRAAKQLAERHVDELRKTWIAEGRKL